MTAPEKTNWDIVKTQFARHRSAVWGLRIVIALFLLATAAPLLAQSSPFAIREGSGDWRFPWFGDLFDQNVFPSGVDLFFNLLLVFLPIAIGLRYLWRRALRWLPPVFLYCFLALVLPLGFMNSGVGKVAFFPVRFLRYSKPKVSYLKVRRAALDQVLARQKVALYETKLAETKTGLEQTERGLESGSLAPVERMNLQVERDAREETLEMTERRLEEWRQKRRAAARFASDPENRVRAVMPPIGYHHDDNDEERIAEHPTFSGWGIGHYLGTDRNGRDVLARILYGTRVSLTIGVIAVAIYCTIGTILGALMGFFGGWVDMVGMRLVEIMICFPVLAFILIVVAVSETRSIFLIMVAIGIISWTNVARLIRGQFFQERAQDYVTAARALGVPTGRIVFKHVLPNAIHPMFVAATFGIASAILAESTLAFLGLGDPNVPSWGQILLEGRITTKLWLIFSPGVAIFLTVTVLNLVGEGLRDALDPKLRQ